MVCSTMPPSALAGDLVSLLGPEAVVEEPASRYLTDATEGRGVRGRADAVVLPADAEEVARVMAWCYERDVPLIPRGGGTGFAGGAVPLDGGVVVGLERLDRIRSFEPSLWWMQVEAGVRTGTVHRRARESGLIFPPDPGASEQSQIGGNIATNAGGPHAFKYGVTGTWVMGLEVVVPPGELITLGGAIRKDVAGYDLKGLLIGSEGTLAIVTAAWLRLLPAPEVALPIAAFYRTLEAGCEAIERVLAGGLVVAALEYLDAGTLAAAGSSYPGGVPDGAGFMVIAEADGSAAEVERMRGEVSEALAPEALAVHAPAERSAAAPLWRWRDGVSIAVTARRGGKVSEDIVVPLGRLAEAITRTLEIGRRHELAACSFGHAGDGNLHSTFMVEPGDEAELERATTAAAELFVLSAELDGSISGEHGLGHTKGGQLSRQWAPRALELHSDVKRCFDPKGLLNPGKKLA
jgi:glycolate oxidase subunit GlcD